MRAGIEKGKRSREEKRVEGNEKTHCDEEEEEVESSCHVPHKSLPLPLSYLV